MPAYFTVAVTALCHFWPPVLMANTLKRWLPAARLMVVLSCLLEVAVNFFTPSTHSSIRAIVPVTVEAAFPVFDSDFPPTDGSRAKRHLLRKRSFSDPQLNGTASLEEYKQLFANLSPDDITAIAFAKRLLKLFRSYRLAHKAALRAI